MIPSPVAADPEPALGLVVIAASRGGLAASGAVLAALPQDLRAAAAVVQHRTSRLPQLLTTLLQRRTSLRVVTATSGVALERGVVYVIPPDRHALVTPQRTLELIDGSRIHHVRSSANPLLETAASVYGPRVVAVVLTGGGRDATDGVQVVDRSGGVVLVEDPATAQAPSMPLSAIHTGSVRAVLPVTSIGPEVARIVAAW